MSNTNVIRQFIVLPIILFIVLFAIGIVGIFSSYKLSGKINSVSDTALGPSLVFAEASGVLQDLKQELDKISDQRISVDEQKKAVKSIKKDLRQISKLIGEQAEKSKTYVFFGYLNKWLIKWSAVEKNINTQVVETSSSLNLVTTKELSEQTEALQEEMKNINDFIQSDVKDSLNETASFAKKAILFLVVALIIGLAVSIFSSVFVVKKVKVLIDEIQKSRRNMENLLNNLAQGYFIFNNKGEIQTGASKICEMYYNQVVENKNLEDILPISEHNKSSIQDWLQLTFAGDMDFDSMKSLGPKEFTVNGNQFELKYRPIYNSINESQLDNIICITTDVTEEKLLRSQAADESAFVKMLVKAVKDRNVFKNNIEEMQKISTEAVKEIAQKNPDIKSLFRYLHTLKGVAASLHLLKYSQKAHLIESKLAEIRNSSGGDLVLMYSEIGKDIADLEKLLVDFFIEHRAVLDKILGKAEDGLKKEISKESIQTLSDMVIQVQGKKSDLYRYIEDRFILEPIENLFDHYSDTIEQLAEKLDKKVEFQIEKSNILIQPEKFSSLASAFIHVIRNSLDHGIEYVHERIDLEKNPTAKIKLKFAIIRKDNLDFLKIQFSDDGRGINTERVRQKALTLDLYTASALSKLSEEQICQIIFQNGFSTSEQVTDTSGRGIGMDAILNEAQNLKGVAWIESEKNKGTVLYIEIPFLVSDSI